MIALMIYIAIIWVIAYLICMLLPVPAKGQTVIYILAGLFTLIIVLQLLGGGSGNLSLPKI